MRFETETLDKPNFQGNAAVNYTDRETPFRGLLSIMTGIITSESVELNRRSAEKLKLDFYAAGCKDKASAIRTICAERDIALENVAYVGDDINDLEAVRMVGLGCCPANAVQAVKQQAKYVAKASGGDGAIRDVVEYILYCNKGEN